MSSDRLNIDDARLMIGRRVRYHGGHGRPERGVITSVGPGWNGYVFVRYDGDQQGKATRAEDLSAEAVTPDEQ